MAGFIFNTVKSIICEAGSIDRLGEIVKAEIGKKVMLVTDPGIVKAGLLQPVLELLEQADVETIVYSDVEADPAERIILEATALAVANNIEGVIGFGGGSSMDVAKLVALLAKGKEQLADIYGIGMVKGSRLPLIQVPTTAGTGSEVTPISIITIGDGLKMAVVAPQLLPDVALLDAKLTLGLPTHVTAATGVDAMVHAIEAYTSLSANHNPVSDALAKQALTLLGANIKRVVSDGSDYQARSEMLLGSLLAGQAFANSPVAAVHALAYPIGGLFHVPHGLSNALVLPHVMRFNAKACAKAYAELAPLVFPETTFDGDYQAVCETFIHCVESLNEQLGLETRLRQVGIEEHDLERLASEAMKQTRLLANNPIEVAESDALEIYRTAW